MLSGREEAMEKLRRGQGCAVQLKTWLDNPTASNASVSIEHLSNAIFDCFSDALSIFVNDSTDHQSYEFSQSSSGNAPRSSSPHSTLSGGGVQRLCPDTITRKTSAEGRVENWRDDSPTPLYHDGYIWRKYGQKEIKHSKHQRSYYRCTYDEVCKAKKYVQKIQDNPPVYRTTYFGKHTCQNRVSTFPVPLDHDDDDHSSGTIIRFDKHNQEIDPFSPLTRSVNHQESVRNEVIDQTNQYNNLCTMAEQSQTSDYPPSPGTMMFESPTFLDTEAMLDTSEYYPSDQPWL